MRIETFYCFEKIASGDDVLAKSMISGFEGFGFQYRRISMVEGLKSIQLLIELLNTLLVCQLSKRQSCCINDWLGDLLC